MRLSVVIPVLGQPDLARVCIDLALQNRVVTDTEVIVVDNGADLFLEGDKYRDVITFVPDHNLGVYPVFPFGFEVAKGDVVLFIHSDLLIVEKGYDNTILEAFERDSKLGLVGFVGSDEIDSIGGRGAGTTSNFQGRQYTGVDKMWIGSPARAHGKTNPGLTNAAVVDGCAMAIRRSSWETIGYREDFPPHHFYDRLISTQMLEAGLKVGVLGIACDHISGQTVNSERGYHNLAKEYSEAHIPQDKWVGNPPDYAWDQTVYQEAERRWLKEYRDQKHLIPIKVKQ